MSIVTHENVIKFAKHDSNQFTTLRVAKINETGLSKVKDS